MSEMKTEIARQLHAAQDKYVYFLLAVAASGIAFSVQRTTGAALSWQMIPLGLAVLAWAFSFYAGCRNRVRFECALHANSALLQMGDGTYPGLPRHPELVRAACEGTREAIEHQSTLMGF